MRILSTLVVLLASLTIVACGSVPILNVSNAPAVNASGKTLSPEQVKSAIIRAGAGLGWQMKEDGPGKITATLELRNHTAAVDIPYSPASYSIVYKSSSNLHEGGGNIHKNYNGWIQNLTRAINVQLAAS